MEQGNIFKTPEYYKGLPGRCCGESQCEPRSKKRRDPCAGGRKRRGKIHADENAFRNDRSHGRDYFCGWKGDAFFLFQRCDRSRAGNGTSAFHAGSVHDGGRESDSGAETGNAFKVDRKKAVSITRELSEKYNLKVDAEEKVEDISLAMRQKLEILKALYRGAHVLILDEPTAVLTPQETEELFEQLKLLRDSGHTIIFISHKLNEVKELCSRMTILRDGKTMGTYDIADLDEHQISRLMVGRDVSLDIEKEEGDFGKAIFSVKDLVYADAFGKTRLNHVSFSIREGQILGIAGIDGNGQSELVEAIVGTLKPQKGQVFLNGKDLSDYSVLKRQEAGISHVSEDRMRYGTAPKFSLEDNMISKIYYTDKLRSHGLIDRKKVNTYTNKILKEFLVKYDNSHQSVSELSGGNVQKLVVGRRI